MRKMTVWIHDHGDMFFALFGLCFIWMMLRLVVVALVGRDPEEDFWANALLVLATGSILVYFSGFLMAIVIRAWDNFWGIGLIPAGLEKSHTALPTEAKPDSVKVEK